MNVDIVEVVRQKQQKQPRIASIENGDMVDIDVCNDKVIVRVPAGPGPEEEIELSEIVSPDD